MRYEIFENGTLINTIEASDEFVSAYCETNGYTYEAAPIPEPTPEPGLETLTEMEMQDYLADLDLRVCLLELGLSEEDII